MFDTMSRHRVGDFARPAGPVEGCGTLADTPMKRLPCACLASLLLAAAHLAAPARAAEPGVIQSLASGKCVDLERGATSDGPVVIQFDCHAGPNQRWSLVQSGGGGYRIESGLSGKCIGIDRLGPANSGVIVQSACGAGGSEQLWSLEGGGGGTVIKSVQSGLCLTLPGGSRVNGVRLVARRCTGCENQAWQPRP